MLSLLCVCMHVCACGHVPVYTGDGCACARLLRAEFVLEGHGACLGLEKELGLWARRALLPPSSTLWAPATCCAMRFDWRHAFRLAPCVSTATCCAMRFDWRTERRAPWMVPPPAGVHWQDDACRCMMLEVIPTGSMMPAGVHWQHDVGAHPQRARAQAARRLPQRSLFCTGGGYAPASTAATATNVAAALSAAAAAAATVTQPFFGG